MNNTGLGLTRAQRNVIEMNLEDAFNSFRLISASVRLFVTRPQPVTVASSNWLRSEPGSLGFQGKQTGVTRDKLGES